MTAPWLSVYAALIAGASAYFLWKRLHRYLRYFQQEEYDGRRLVRWYLEKRAFDRRGSTVAAGGLVLSGISHWLLLFAGQTLASLGLCWIARSEENPVGHGKIRLNLTARARRIRNWSFGLLVAGLLLMQAIALLTPYPLAWMWFFQIVLLQACPFALIAGNWLLRPFERREQDRYLQEANETFRRLRPYTIGITGSYGKTSTKVLLSQIMDQALAPTFTTPKSINTLMGITREIRERLTPAHRYAVIEMGAYNRGSIQRLCALTPPDAAIVTVVGLMHLERFGSQENIVLAKSELAQAVPEAGVLVCNGDNEGARRIAEMYPKATTLFYGSDVSRGAIDCRIGHMETTPQGTGFSFVWRGETYQGFTPQLGRPALENLAAAFTMACALGADPQYVLAIARNLKPEKNRLEPTRQGKAVVLNDAYNSNPVGFQSALEVFAAMPGQRRFLVTPGMVELGPVQADENRKIARQAAGVCDQVYLVGDVNRAAWEQGLREGGLPEGQVHCFPHRDLALAQLFGAETNLGEDVILIENDLPDLYEGSVRF